ncbi:STAS domain-containing protein [Streptomyces sp. R-07]|uniref:STAS domain-containing protein n=1 Tax=unclassified Streptomyces TaxID=2593676 RepID=UPI003412C1ED
MTRSVTAPVVAVVAGGSAPRGEIATEQLVIRLAPDETGRGRVLVRGEIDIQGAPDLHQALVLALGTGSGRLLVNLAEVSFSDCSGLNVLLKINARARRMGVAFVLEAPSASVDRLLSLTKSRKVFTIRDVPEA